MSATALVRVKRGSTWMILAPLDLGLHRPAEGDRVALRHVGAHDDDAVGVGHAARDTVVAAPRPSRVPRPGTLELCHIRAWFSMATTPRPRISFWWMWFHSLSSVAPPSEKMAGRHAFDELAVGAAVSMNVSSRVFLTSSATRSIARSRSHTSQSVAPGARCSTCVGPVGIDVQLVDGRALGAEGALVVRAARIALDVDDLAVDGVDERGAADRADRDRRSAWPWRS